MASGGDNSIGRSCYNDGPTHGRAKPRTKRKYAKREPNTMEKSREWSESALDLAEYTVMAMVDKYAPGSCDNMTDSEWNDFINFMTGKKIGNDNWDKEIQ